MAHPDKIRYDRLRSAVASTTSIYRDMVGGTTLRLMKISSKLKDNEAINKDITYLSNTEQAAIQRARDVQGSNKNSEYLVRLSSHLQDVSKVDTKTVPIKHDFNLRDISEGAALSMFEFPLHIEALKGRLDEYLSLGIIVKEADLHLKGEDWLERIRHHKNNVVVLSYLLSLSDATYRKNVDAVKIMSSVARGEFVGNPELESAWSDIAAKAYSGDDFEVWRKERSKNIIEHFTDGDISLQNITLKKGSFETLLATLPLFRFDAVHGIKSGNTQALMGAYSNNANGIADLMGIQVNESGILEGQTMVIGNVPKSILTTYDANDIGMCLK
jgi:hypothetical protein